MLGKMPFLDAGSVKDGDSLHCKLSGIFGIVTLVVCMVRHFDISSGGIHAACDNQQALRVFHPNFLPNPQQANFDLMIALVCLLHQSPLQWMCEHVRGHQDSKLCHRPLTRLENLNVQMDKLAQVVWTHYAQHDETLPLPTLTAIYVEGWQLWHGNTKISDPSVHNIYAILQEPTTQMWWIRHQLIPQSEQWSIDWEGMERMMHALTPPEQRYVTKHASENCGVGSTLVQWKLQPDPCCP